VVTVEGSADLQDWGEPVLRVTPGPGNLPEAPAGYEWVSYRLKDRQLDLGHGFLRVTVTEDP